STHKWVTTILDLLNRYNGKLVIILDDFHILTNEQLLDSIDYFLKNIPQSIHVYLLSRTYPHLSMSKLRLNGDLHELHEQELRFTYEEIKQFFHTVTPLHLEQPLLTFIQFRTEGWAAGIRM